MGDFANQYVGCAFRAGILVDYRLRGVRRSRENSVGSFGDFGVSRGDIFFVQKDVVRRQREGAQTSYLLPAVAVLAVMMIVRKVAMAEADCCDTPFALRSDVFRANTALLASEIPAAAGYRG